MAQIKMIAVKRHKYGTTWYDPGDEYNAKHRRDALILEALKKAIIQLAPATPPPDPAPAKKTTTRKTTTAKKSTTAKKTTVKKSTTATAKKTEPKKTPKPVAGMTTKDMKAKKKDDDEEKDPAADKERGTYERRDLRAKE